MRIITNSDIDTFGTGIWAVVADWFGAERVVFQGTILQCAAYKADA